MKSFSIEKSKLLLKNKYVLYFVFILALSNIVQLTVADDYTSIVIFILVGFLTSFFSKNMIVILIISIVTANSLRYGTNIANPWIVSEGFSQKNKNVSSKVVIKPANGPVTDALKKNKNDSFKNEENTEDENENENENEDEDTEEQFMSKYDSAHSKKSRLVEKDALDDLRHEMKLGFKRMSQNIDSLSMSNMFN